MPLGIFEKLPRPISFCSFMQKGQWSVETIWRSLVRRLCQRWCWWPSWCERSGVEQTHLAPSSSPHSSDTAASCSSSDR